MKWIYKTIKYSPTGWFTGGRVDEHQLDGILNEAGQDGWELVSGFNVTQAYGSSKSIVFIFKKIVE